MLVQRTWSSRTYNIQELKKPDWLEPRVMEKVTSDEADKLGKEKNVQGFIAHIKGLGFSPKINGETLKGFKQNRGMIMSTKWRGNRWCVGDQLGSNYNCQGRKKRVALTSMIHWKWGGKSEFETYLRDILNRIGE